MYIGFEGRPVILPDGEPSGQLEVEGVADDDQQGVEHRGPVGHNSRANISSQFT